MVKGGLMKRGVIAVATVLSLVFVVPAFAVDGSQPATTTTAPNFEQMKADHLKKLDERMTSLQQEKTCVQAAKILDDLKACRAKHRAEMKEHRDDMRMKGHGGPAGEGSPQGK
jgi:hypothetical protein